MKLTIVALGLLMPALCVAAPSPHSGCHHTRYKTIYETIYGVECHTRYDTKCRVKYETDYRVTITHVQNLRLTSEQKFRFGLTCPALARPKRNL